MSRRVTGFWILLAGLIGIGAGVMTAKNENLPQDLPDVHVELQGPLAEVKGIEWRYSDGKSMEVLFHQKPIKLHLLLPTGHAFSTTTQSLFMWQTDQVVGVVKITPAPKLLSYSDAVRLASSICEDLGLGSDEEVQKRLRLWRDNPETILLNETSDGVVTAPRITKSLRVDLDSDTSFYLEVRTHINGKGWYVVVEFAVIEALLE